MVRAPRHREGKLYAEISGDKKNESGILRIYKPFSSPLSYCTVYGKSGFPHKPLQISGLEGDIALTILS
jgi:hypothetical protein